jgi:hypothetical protein
VSARQWRRLFGLNLTAGQAAWQLFGGVARSGGSVTIGNYCWRAGRLAACIHTRDGSGQEEERAMDNVLLRAVDNTIRFLRMAAIELRRIAEAAPDIADQLRHIADQLDTDADDLERAAGSSRT